MDGLLLILLLGRSLIAAGGPVELRSQCSALPFGLLLGDKGRESKSVEVQRVWDVYDERLQKNVSSGCLFA